MNHREIARSLRERADRVEATGWEYPRIEPRPAPEPQPGHSGPSVWHARAEDFPFQVAADGTAVSLPTQGYDDPWVIAEGPLIYVAEHLADFIRRAQAALDQITAMEDT